MLSKTHLCHHKEKVSCAENVIRSFSRTFSNILILKIIGNNFTYFGNPKKLVKNLLSYKSNKDNVRFALFLALMNATYKMVLCILRRYFESDKKSAPIAGFIAGLWSILDVKKRRQFLTCLLLSRFCDTGIKMSVEREYVPQMPHFEVATWFLCAIVQQYICSYEVDCLNKGVNSFLRKWAAYNPNDVYM